MNPRVVAPPGVPQRNGRRNVVVATPMRSGTHLMIDLVLNNIAAYRTCPLYVDLDQCRKQSRAGQNLVVAIASDAGHVVKTHLLIGLDAAAVHDPDLLRVIDDAVVVTVERDREIVLRSLSRWHRSEEMLRQFEIEYDEFWAFWRGRADIALQFEDLLVRETMTSTLQELAGTLGVRTRPRVKMPPPPDRKRRIYANKGLTRVLGSRAPRIDTTIHTLKV